MRRNLLLCSALVLSGIHAQEASVPLDSVSVEGTAISKETILEIAGLHIGTPVNKAAIEQGCRKLQESGIFLAINYRYASGPRHGYTLTLSLMDHGTLANAAIDIPGVDENETWQCVVSKHPEFNRKVPDDGA